MFNSEYIKQIIFDCMLMFSIISFLAIDGKYIFHNEIIIITIFILAAFNVIFGFKCLSLKSDILEDRSSLIAICSSENILNWYNFFKYTLGFGCLAYISYISNSLYMALAIGFFIVSKYFLMFILKNKNSEIFKVS